MAAMLLNVWLRDESGESHAVGQLAVTEPTPPNGARSGAFRYAAEYLANPVIGPIDPIHLPLQAAERPAADPHTGLHGAFIDSLPDAWGRAVMARRFQVARAEQGDIDLLVRLEGHGMGALAYTRTPEAPSADSETVPSALSLDQLLDAADRYQAHPEQTDDAIRLLFAAGSSPGGARPKALVQDGDQQCLAKFPSPRDTLDIVGLEAASLDLARAVGIPVPNFRLVDVADRKVLVLDRFDVTPAGGRLHMLSLQTLLDARGYYQLGYRDLIEVIARISSRPQTDLEQLFRQIVLNAYLANTDDHLKNFAMQWRDGGWRLTPAFDILPDVNDNREHVLHFGSAGNRPTPAALRELGRLCGLGPKRGDNVIAMIEDIVRSYATHCEARGVPEADVDYVVSRMPLLSDTI